MHSPEPEDTDGPDALIARMLDPTVEPDERLAIMIEFFDFALILPTGGKGRALSQVQAWGLQMRGDDSLPPLQDACVAKILQDVGEAIRDVCGSGGVPEAIN